MELVGKQEHLEIIAMFESKKETARIELEECYEYRDSDKDRIARNEAIIDCMNECIRSSIKLFNIKVIA